MEAEKSNETLCQKDLVLSSYVINMLITVLLLIVICYHIAIVFVYLFQNLIRDKSKLLTYWFDYIVIYVCAVLFVLCYLIQQVEYFVQYNNHECFTCQQVICLSVYFFGVVLMVLCGNNVLLDIIKGFNLANTMDKVSKIQITELNRLIEAFKAIDFNKIINKKYHIKELFILGAVYLVIIISFGLVLGLKAQNIIDAFRVFFLVFRGLHLIMMALMIIVFKVLAVRKKQLLENNYHSHNLIMQRIYNTNSAKLAYFSDFLTYKAIVDSVGNFPVLFFLSLKKLSTAPLLILYICYCVYLFFTAAIFIYVDRLYKVKASSFVKRMLCLRTLNFHFGAKEKAKLFEEFNFDYSNEEERFLKELNVETKVAPIIDIGGPLVPSKRINQSVNYFIIYKLLYLFFKENEPIYTATQRAMEDEGAAFKSLNKPKAVREQTVTYLLDERISRMSRISKMNQKALKTQFKFTLDTLMSSLQEREYKQDFKNNLLNQNNDKANAEFVIESLFGSILYELFPFYQLAINDMLKSLDPNYNKGLYDTFQEAVKSNVQYNEFHTKDSFLFFETYDHPFIEFDKMKQFFVSYQAYLLNVIKNVSYTFLPLVIGVYHITYLDYNKIIILYRHPLSLVPFVKLKNWVKYYITESKEESSVSQKHTDVIDIGEIEVKNNIKLSIEEFEEVSRNLLNDSLFIKELPFLSYPKIILFVGDKSLSLGQSQANPLFDSENEMMTLDEKDSKLFDLALNDSIVIGDGSSRLRYPSREYGSEIESLFEKTYEIKGDFIVKISFASLFRDSCTLNKNEKNPKCKLGPENYCN